MTVFVIGPEQTCATALCDRGASDFFYDLFGPRAGQNARTVLEVADLPSGIAVEINGEFLKSS